MSNENNVRIPRTLGQLAQEAIDVQNACNLSGVVHGFSMAMEDLCKYIHGTEARNTHPICVLWSNKIASLTGSEEFLDYVKAFDACKDLAKQ